MKKIWIFLLFLLLRLLSIFIIQSWYVPDEYWQSLEVGHKLAFGYGYLTWEWIKGIRSYVHPLLIAGIYKSLAYFQLDHVELLILVPRILQAVLSAYADYRFIIWTRFSKWSAFLLASSWFLFYIGSRTLSNSIEYSLTTIALSYFPFAKGLESTTFLWFVAILTFLRPTGAIPWIPLCFFHIKESTHSIFQLLLKRYIPIGLFIGSIMIGIDSLAHGQFIVTPFEFFKFNFINEIGSFYGSNEWYWYFINGVPVIMGLTFPPFLFAACNVLRYPRTFPVQFKLVMSIILTIAIYSYMPHKEYRFISSLLPMSLYITSDCLSRWSRKANGFLIWFGAILLLASNLGAVYYLGQVHQVGTIKVMHFLEKIAREYRDEHGRHAKFLFLMPCHSTPFYSHIHQNISMRFLTCQPNFNNEAHYADEADEFFMNPSKWMRSHIPVYPPTALPTHIIFFDKLLMNLLDFIKNYSPIYRTDHASFASDRVGTSVVVYERNKIEITPEMERFVY